VSAGAAQDTVYLQALALSTMVRLDDRTDAAYGWPVVSYCREGVHALQCHHDDLWIRNASPLVLRDVRICVARAARAYFEIAGAGNDGCLHADIGAHADRQIDVREAPTPQADYPPFAKLELDLSQAAWHGGVVLHRLRLPVLRPQTFFALSRPAGEDEQHAMGVQTRRVDLLSELVVFTYHGSGQSVARLSSIGLDDPHKAMRIIARASRPAPFARYRVPECTARAQPSPGQVHALDSGMSCAVLVSATDIHAAPYVMGPPRSLRDSHAVTRHEKPPLADYADRVLRPDEAQAFRALLHAHFRLFRSQGRTSQLGPRVPLAVREVIVAGGDFDAAGQLGQFEHPVPHLVFLYGPAISAPTNLMLAPHNRVQAISASPDGRRLFIGGMLRPLVPMSVDPAVSMLAVDEGSQWSFWNRNNGPDGPVLALAASRHRLYVGGSFQRVAGSQASGIVAMRVPAIGISVIHAHGWELMDHGLYLRQMGDPPLNGIARSILPLPDGRVVLGGSFGLRTGDLDLSEHTQIPIAFDSNVVIWNPQNRRWHSIGVLMGQGGTPYASMVSALCVYAHRVYAGGLFSWGSDERDGVRGLVRLRGWARYEPGAAPRWVGLAQAFESRVRSCVETPQGLYVGGDFDDALNHSRRVLLRWDGHQLAGAGQPLAIAPTEDAYVDALAAIGSRVFIGGDFRQLSDGTSVANLARFDGQTGQASRIGHFGVNGTVRALARIWELRAGFGD
jgi:hypothetical protein